MKHSAAKVAWAYLAELLLVALAMTTCILSVGVANTAELAIKLGADFATLYCAVFFAAALGFLWTLYSKADTDFYAWLDDIGAFSVYIHATTYVVAVEAFAIFLSIAAKYYLNQTISLVAVFFFLLALINSYTLIANVVGLMNLHTEFNRKGRRGNSKP